MRWLRGEFTTRTDARAALGVRTIVDDASVYDQLKLMARFVRLAGFSGLLVCLDEMVNLYKLANTQARNANYEQILRILNDSLQGSAAHLGFLFGGTPDFLLDPRAALLLPALQSPAAPRTRFAADGLVDYSGPVLRLANLTPEDFFVLLRKLRHVLRRRATRPATWCPTRRSSRSWQHCAERIGDAYFRTPRTTIKAFLDLLACSSRTLASTGRHLLGNVDHRAGRRPRPCPTTDGRRARRAGRGRRARRPSATVPHRLRRGCTRGPAVDLRPGLDRPARRPGTRRRPDPRPASAT